MNMKELKEWKETQKKKYKQEHLNNIEEWGSCKGLTDKEYKRISVVKMKNTTRRVHSKGNLWNHQNLNRIKSDVKYWWK